MGVARPFLTTTRIVRDGPGGSSGGQQTPELCLGDEALGLGGNMRAERVRVRLVAPNGRIRAAPRPFWNVGVSFMTGHILVYYDNNRR